MWESRMEGCDWFGKWLFLDDFWLSSMINRGCAGMSQWEDVPEAWHVI